jgi:hypothetical protein
MKRLDFIVRIVLTVGLFGLGIQQYSSWEHQPPALEITASIESTTLEFVLACYRARPLGAGRACRLGFVVSLSAVITTVPAPFVAKLHVPCRYLQFRVQQER